MERVLFEQDPIMYLTILAAAGGWFLLFRTRLGLHIRAVGEDPYAAYAQGVPVRRSRMLAIILGGFLSGIGGAHLSLAYTQLWAERMTAGQGLIAVGLVIVAGWHPLRVLLVTYLFGVLIVLHPNLQASGNCDFALYSGGFTVSFCGAGFNPCDICLCQKRTWIACSPCQGI